MNTKDHKGNHIRIIPQKNNTYDAFVTFGKGNFASLDKGKITPIREGKTQRFHGLNEQQMKHIVQVFANRFGWSLSKIAMQKTPRLIGEGSFGCVYYPTYRCAKGDACPAEGCGNVVSKLMTEEDAEEEFEKSKLIRRIDSKGLYHWKILKMCEAPRDQMNFRGCELAEDEELTHMLMYPFGGRPFTNIVDGLAPFGKATLFAIRNLIKALVVFGQHRFVHADIKPDNIVFTGGVHKDDPVKLKYIDFGVSFRWTPGWEWEQGPYPTAYYPPELFLLSGGKNAREFSMVFERESEAVAQVGRSNYGDVENILRTENSIKGWDLVSKFDVYSLGITLWKARKQLDVSPVAQEMYTTLCKHMIDLSLETRYTPEQALKVINKVILYA